MEGRVVSQLLLLVQRDLVIELLEKELRVLQNVAILLFYFLFRLDSRLLLQVILGNSIDLCLVRSQCCKLVVEVVSVEEGLHRIPPQVLYIFDELCVFQVFPLLADVLLVEIILHWRNKGGSNSPLVEIIPWEVTQPWVVLHFV